MNLLSLVGLWLDNIYQIRRKWYYSSGWKNLQSKRGLGWNGKLTRPEPTNHCGPQGHAHAKQGRTGGVGDFWILHRRTRTPLPFANQYAMLDACRRLVCRLASPRTHRCSALLAPLFFSGRATSKWLTGWGVWFRVWTWVLPHRMFKLMHKY
jgi:hypothetical protein